MADFHQPRFVPTLHAIGQQRPKTDEVAARARARQQAITLVLPALAAEVDGPAFPRILHLLEQTRLVDRVIVVLGAGTPTQEQRADTLTARLPATVTLVRLADPRVRQIERRVAAAGVDGPVAGKGHACWVGVCVALAGAGSDVIALHDCDIVTYHPAMLTRLVAPLVMPDTPFDFAKGYYPRVAGTLHGRVTRLLVAPLLRALQSVATSSTLPAFLADYRYPLAGEVAFSRRLAEVLPMHPGWGLEIGTLGEVYRRQRAFRVCQVDIAETYDHRHRPMRADDGGDLARMTDEVLTTLVRLLRREQVACDPQTIRYVLAHYRTEAARCVDAYQADAAVNGLPYDAGHETALTTAFAAAIEQCAANGLPSALTPHPSWHHLQQHAPDACAAFADLGRACTRGRAWRAAAAS
jgi:glucosyl-3-phosphoglycerate synthase